MNDIIEVLKKTLYTQTTISSLGYVSISRIYDSVKAGSYYLSCQGSAGHYCYPKDLLPIDTYDSLEVAVYRNNKMLNIAKSSVIRKFTEYDKLIEHNDGHVLGWVPIELLNELFKYLKNYGK